MAVSEIIYRLDADNFIFNTGESFDNEKFEQLNIAITEIIGHYYTSLPITNIYGNDELLDYHPNLCLTSSTFIGTIQSYRINNSTLNIYILNESRQVVSAIIIIFNFKDDDTVESLAIPQLCSGLPGNGTILINIVKDIGNMLNVNRIYLNPTPSSLPFYGKQGFIYNKEMNESEYYIIPKIELPIIESPIIESPKVKSPIIESPKVKPVKSRTKTVRKNSISKKSKLTKSKSKKSTTS
jgi:hypothetical protein